MIAMATTRDPSYASTNLWNLVAPNETLTSTFTLQPSTFDLTQCHYDHATGLLTAKIYSDGYGPSYDYTPDGQLTARMWVRETEVESVMVPVTTSYTYADSGELLTVTYNDGTPGATFTYDRLGRQETVTDALGTRTFVYDPETLALVEEQLPGNVTLLRGYDAFGRAEGIAIENTDYLVQYAYDALGRFASVGAFDQAAVYTYTPDSDLPAGWTIDIPEQPFTLNVTRDYEALRDLVSEVGATVDVGAGPQPVSLFAYTNDAIGRRTARVDNGLTQNAFSYNLRSEVTGATMGTDTYSYDYDPIGNRVESDEPQFGAREYLANELNQYIEIDNAVTLVPTYDADGNMLTYGDWTFTWDGENRLIRAENGSVKVENAYDYMSRRIAKAVYEWDTDHWALDTERTFLYDGWAMISETIHDSPSTTHNSYIYGLDLSGSLQGAGTVGGLLAAFFDEVPVFYAYDANGNVTELVALDGTTAAAYEYDPFGNTTSATGPLAAVNPYRFSTKYTDDSTGLLYYGYRYYNPELGRWINRDPIGERGGVNLMAKVTNNQIGQVDYLGNRIVYEVWETKDIHTEHLISRRIDMCQCKNNNNWVWSFQKYQVRFARLYTTRITRYTPYEEGGVNTRGKRLLGSIVRLIGAGLRMETLPVERLIPDGGSIQKQSPTFTEELIRNKDYLRPFDHNMHLECDKRNEGQIRWEERIEREFIIQEGWKHLKAIGQLPIIQAGR